MRVFEAREKVEKQAAWCCANTKTSLAIAECLPSTALSSLVWVDPPKSFEERSGFHSPSPFLTNQRWRDIKGYNCITVRPSLWWLLNFMTPHLRLLLEDFYTSCRSIVVLLLCCSLLFVFVSYLLLRLWDILVSGVLLCVVFPSYWYHMYSLRYFPSRHARASPNSSRALFSSDVNPVSINCDSSPPTTI